MELFAPLQDLLQRAWNLSMRFLTALIVFVIGWLVAQLIRTVVVKVLKALKVDSISEQTKIAEFLGKGGIKHSLSELFGILIYAVIIVGVLISSLQVLQLQGVSDLLNGILRYVPNVLGAIVVVILGFAVSALVASVVRTAAANIGLNQSALLGKITQVIIVVVTALMALDILNIGSRLGKAFEIVLASVGLALALAFGIGCKDLAGDVASDFLEKLKKK